MSESRTVEKKIEKEEGRFIGFTENAWVVLTTLFIGITILYLLETHSSGQLAFEPLLHLTTIAIELLVGYGGYYKARQDRRQREKEREHDRNDIKTHMSNIGTNIVDQLSDKRHANTQITALKRQADIKFMSEIWVFIASSNLEEICLDLTDGRADYDFYRGSIIDYIAYRIRHPELSFYDEQLQELLEAFDDSLIKFDNQLSTYADAEFTSHDRMIWIAHYKLRGLEPDVYEEKVAEFKKALDLGKIMLEKHRVFVARFRDLYPEFFISHIRDK